MKTGRIPTIVVASTYSGSIKINQHWRPVIDPRRTGATVGINPTKIPKKANLLFSIMLFETLNIHRYFIGRAIKLSITERASVSYINFQRISIKLCNKK